MIFNSEEVYMRGVNKVILVGTLGTDPIVRTTKSQDLVVNLSIATNEYYVSNGEKKEKTEWHKVVFYKKLAEIASKYLKKGSTIFVEGKLSTSKYTDKNGIEKYVTNIIAQELQFLDKKAKENNSEINGNVVSSEQEQMELNDEIPF
jgi:single-strand DNA-binding protein